MPYLSNGKEKVKVSPNQSLVDAAESLGIPFSCTEGNCGTCLSEVIEGIEYLLPINNQEDMFGLHPQERLLCQARFSPDAGEEDTLVVKV